jgi:deaminated glutathione amidase
MAQGTTTVATCQFPTSSNIDSNLGYVLEQMRTAKARGADIAHFPEACLSGYAGIDMPSHESFDWPLLAEAVRAVLALAGKLRLWVVLGSAHRLTEPNKPHNSLYIIDEEGRLIDRYDKRFCSGDASGMTGDLAHYSPGDHFSVFAIRGIRCGALICVDCRYPELYREYKRRGVALVFHSFHSGHIDANDFAAREAMVGSENFGFNPATTLPGITQPAMMHAAAGSNHVWISCPNSSAPRSCWPSFFVRPDGVVTGRLELHEAGVLISQVDTAARFYDSTSPWRERAMDGILYSGVLVRDARSDVRTEV